MNCLFLLMHQILIHLKGVSYMHNDVTSIPHSLYLRCNTMWCTVTASTQSRTCDIRHIWSPGVVLMLLYTVESKVIKKTAKRFLCRCQELKNNTDASYVFTGLSIPAPSNQLFTSISGVVIHCYTCIFWCHITKPLLPYFTLNAVKFQTRAEKLWIH